MVRGVAEQTVPSDEGEPIMVMLYPDDSLKLLTVKTHVPARVQVR